MRDDTAPATSHREHSVWIATRAKELIVDVLLRLPTPVARVVAFGVRTLWAGFTRA